MATYSYVLDIVQDTPIVLTGGCALNAKSNTRLAETFRYFVPAAPHDGGLAIGGALAASPPRHGSSFAKAVARGATPRKLHAVEPVLMCKQVLRHSLVVDVELDVQKVRRHSLVAETVVGERCTWSLPILREHSFAE